MNMKIDMNTTSLHITSLLYLQVSYQQ